MNEFLRPIILVPECKEFIWGGYNLGTKWNKPEGKIAETWELSCHDSGLSRDKESGKTLKEILEAEPSLMGELPEWTDGRFPLLFKLIDAKSNLSIQVHPSDEYAEKNEGQLGKTEMWYVLDAEEGAGMYCGFNRPTDASEVKKRLLDGTICDILNFIKAKRGDTLYIPSGTVHAICAGLTIAEIQENSSVTYRLYDYGRVDKDGKQRELHIDKSLDVIDYSAVAQANATVKAASDGVKTLADSKYFRTYEITAKSFSTQVQKNRFRVIMAFNDCDIAYCGGVVNVKKGDTVFLPAGLGEITISGENNWLLLTVLP